MRLPRQHLKTLVFKCFLAMTGNSKFRGDPSGAGPIAGIYGAIFVGFFAALFGGTPARHDQIRISSCSIRCH